MKSNCKRNKFLCKYHSDFHPCGSCSCKLKSSLIDTNNVCVLVSISDVYKHYLKKLKKKVFCIRFNFCVVIGIPSRSFINICIIRNVSLTFNEHSHYSGILIESGSIPSALATSSFTTKSNASEDWIGIVAGSAPSSIISKAISPVCLPNS